MCGEVAETEPAHPELDEKSTILDFRLVSS